MPFLGVQTTRRCYAAILSTSLLLSACGGGSGGATDTTAEGTPLSTDSASRPDSSDSTPSVEIETALPIPLTGDGCLSTAELETKFVALINAARSEARQCGDTEYAAARTVSWDERLEGAALTHSKDMANNNFFSHIGTDSSSVLERATIAEYDWNNVAENIAAGQRTIEQVTQAWLDSPPHCTSIMRNVYDNIGVSCHDNANSTFDRYWTMVLGRASN